jgi:hypothetical protein
MSDDLKEYALLYSKYFRSADGTNVELDRAFYLRWIRSTPQSSMRTAVSFENYIINSSEYNQKLYLDFKRIYSYYIEPNCPPAVYEAFITKYGGHVGRSTIISEASITSYVKELPVFLIKYRDVIARLYYMVNSEQIPDNLMVLYLDKFCTQEYTLEDLNNDIMTGRAPTILETCKGGSGNVLQDIKGKWNHIHGGIPSSRVLNTLLSQIGDSEFVLTCLIKQFDMFRNKQIYDVQAAFLTVYKREPYVPEFMKIIEQNIDNFESMHETHLQHFAVVKDLYQNYVAKNISEVDFVKRYVYLIDDSRYVNDIIQELTYSEAYQQEMRVVIRNVFHELYDAVLASDDETHMFEQIKNKKLSLRCHEISEIISVLKTETDSYLSSVSCIYQNIITRKPDTYECVHYKQVYRDDHDVNASETTVRSDLYASLEYHDVLKTKIRKIYEETTGNPILPSKLFALLNQVLKSDVLMKDDVKLREIIM